MTGQELVVASALAVIAGAVFEAARPGEARSSNWMIHLEIKYRPHTEQDPGLDGKEESV